MPKPIITVVGSFAVGMFVRAQRMPVFGETLIGSEFLMGPGGKGPTRPSAWRAWARSRGLQGSSARTNWVRSPLTCTPGKGFGRAYLQRTGDASTGVGVIILNAQGQNGIILDMGANRLMDAAFVDALEPQIAASDVVMTVLEIPVPAAAQAMALGRKHGALTIMNPAPACALAPEALCSVDVLTPNESELRILLGLAPDDPTPTPDLAQSLRRCGVKNIIVTMGGEGL